MIEASIIQDLANKGMCCYQKPTSWTLRLNDKEADLLKQRKWKLDGGTVINAVGFTTHSLTRDDASRILRAEQILIDNRFCIDDLTGHKVQT